MIKKIVVFVCLSLMFLSLSSSVFSQEENTVKVTGTVQEIPEDASYVVIDGQKISISKDIADYVNMEVGDKVELIIQETEQGKVAVDFDYL